MKKFLKKNKELEEQKRSGYDVYLKKEGITLRFYSDNTLDIKNLWSQSIKNNATLSVYYLLFLLVITYSRSVISLMNLDTHKEVSIFLTISIVLSSFFLLIQSIYNFINTNNFIRCVVTASVVSLIVVVGYKSPYGTEFVLGTVVIAAISLNLIKLLFIQLRYQDKETLRVILDYPETYGVKVIPWTTGHLVSARKYDEKL